MDQIVDPSPVGADSGSKPGETPLALVSAIYAAEETEPVLGVQVHEDDQPVLATLVALGYVTRNEANDRLAVTTKGREAIGIKADGVLALPVEVAAVTGNIAESELAARYIDCKVKALDIAAAKHNEYETDYRAFAVMLTETAHEFRIGLHIPAEHIEGRVIPYNEDRSSGISHAEALRVFFDDVHGRNVKAGWWTDITTGEPKKRSVGELFILFITEITEAYDAWAEGSPDDKLPHHPGVGVELADLLIRTADFCGALQAGRIIAGDPANNPGDQMFREVCEIARRYEAIRKTPEAVGEPETADHLPPMDVSLMVDEKLAFNAKREDHKIENRLKDDGKRT